MTRAPNAKMSGFSLIEILVVITLIGLLMGLAVLALGRHSETGREANCRARIQALTLMVESHADRTGGYPPSRLEDLGITDANDVNEGVEALAAALRHRDYSGKRPDERWLGNVDDDRSDSLRSADGSMALLELVDPWDNPFYYVASDAYEVTGVLRLDAGTRPEDVSAHAVKNALTGAYHRFDTFQIRSAGSDGVLDTEDDIANFEIDFDTFPEAGGR
jgi:prepilin-type N-terminal cleavage/methylation domain-containing protein